MEQKFLEHSLLRSENSRGAKVPWNESSWTFRSPGTKVQRNEKARYRPDAVVNSSTVNQFKNRVDRHWSKQEMMYNYET